MRSPSLARPLGRLPQVCLWGGGLALALQLMLLASAPSLPAVSPQWTSMLTLHLLLELVSVTVCLTIVAVSFHTRAPGLSHRASVITGGFLVVAVCDLVHALTYEGMPAFLGPTSTERAIFFWLMGRSAEVLVMLLLATPMSQRLSRGQALAVGAAVSAALVWWGSAGLDAFPTTFVPGTGVTPVKTGWEVVITLANLSAAAYWWRRARSAGGDERHHLLATACWVIGVGELSFAGYVHPSDFLNIFGHAYKIVGYVLLYQAIVVALVRQPFEALAAAEEQARRSEERLRDIADGLPSAYIYELEASAAGDIRYTYLSSSVERVVGVSREVALEDPGIFRRSVHPDDREAYLSAMRRAGEQARVFDFEGRFRIAGGGWRWARVVSVPRPQPGGGLVWHGLVVDVTAQREAERRRHENEQLLAAVIDSASDAVISCDEEGRIRLFNPAAERIFGHRAESMVGDTLDRLLPPDDRQPHARHLKAFAASGASSRRMGSGRVRGRHADGSERELEASISQVRLNDGVVLTAILRDVTDRVRSERLLLRTQVELTELAHRLMDQERQTTRRLAQALHDQLGQTLTAMRIDFVAEATFADPRQARRHARVDALIDQAVSEVRQVLVDLRPTLLDERGLVEALHNEVQTRQHAAEGVALSFEVAPGTEQGRWDADVEYAVFMVAREALGNALVHAAASRITVALSGSDRQLRLQVRDSGRGLSADALASRPGHLGVVGMRERAIAIGARFELRSPPEGGTLVSLEWEAGR